MHYISLQILCLIVGFGHIYSSADTEKKIIVLGDSLTEGYGLNKELAYPSLVQDQLTKEGFKVRIIKSGVSGSTSASGPSRIKWLLKSKPDVIFIALGANDGLRGVDPNEIKKNLLRTIQIAKSNGIQIWLAGMKMPPNYGNSYVKRFEAVFREVAKSEKLPFFPFLLEGMAGNTDLTLPDKLHPNEKGQRIIAKNISEFFKTQLKNK